MPYGKGPGSHSRLYLTNSDLHALLSPLPRLQLQIEVVLMIVLMGSRCHSPIVVSIFFSIIPPITPI